MASDDFTGTLGDPLDTHDSDWAQAGGLALNADVFLTDAALDESIGGGPADRLGIDGWRNKAARYTTSSEDTSIITVVGASVISEGGGPGVRMTSSTLGYTAIMGNISGTTYQSIKVLKNGVSFGNGDGSWDGTQDIEVKIVVSGTTTVDINVYINGSGTPSYTGQDTTAPLSAGNPGWSFVNQKAIVAALDTWSDGVGAGTTTTQTGAIDLDFTVTADWVYTAAGGGASPAAKYLLRL